MMLLKLLKLGFNWLMLYEQKPAGQEETSATSGPDEAVRSGGVMERLIYGTGSSLGCCCGLLHHHQSADISDPAKMHKHNTKAAILTARCHLISVLEVTN